MAETSESQIQTRIIKHMNAQHQDSLSLFLAHHCDLALPDPSSKSPPHPTLEQIHLDHLTILFNRRRYYIPLAPPMQSYTDARTRMKEMHSSALSALDLSDIKISSFTPPTGLIERGFFTFVILVLLCFSSRGNFLPGSLFYEFTGLGYVAGFARFCFAVQPWLVGFIVLVHLGEVAWFAGGRLRRFRVVEGGGRGLWWLWVGSCLVDGYGTIRRFDGLVRGLEGEKKEMDEKAKKG